MTNNLIIATAMLGLFFVHPAHSAGNDVSDEVSRLETGSPADQQSAMASLAKRGSEAVPALMNVARGSKDKMARVRATKTLKQILKSDPAAARTVVSDVQSMVQSQDLAVADAGVSLAVEIKTAQGADIIRGAVMNHPNELVRGKAVTALGVATNRGKEEVPTLLEALKDKSEFVRLRAAGALGQVGRNDGLALCLEVLRRDAIRKNWSAQIEASESAGEIGDKAALPVLEKVAAADAYGPAKGRAKIAILAIKLAQTSEKKDQMAILAAGLHDIATGLWAAYKLKALGTSEATQLIRTAAADANNPARSDVQRVLAQVPDEH